MSKKRGLLGKLFRKAYVNYMHDGIDPEEPHNAQGLTLEEALEIASESTYKNSQQYRDQQLVDAIAQNQEELTRRTISQGMTWLMPKVMKKMDDIKEELEKK